MAWLALIALLFCVGFPLMAAAWALLESSAPWQQLFEPLILKIVWITVLQATCSAVIAGIGGYVLGCGLTSIRTRSRWARVQRILALPQTIPTLLAVTAWIALLGRYGVLARMGWQVSWLYTWTAVILVHVVYNIPLVALAVGEARMQIPVAHDEMLQLFQARGWQRFTLLLWPRTRNAWFLAVTQVFNYCMMSFTIVLLLGGGPPVLTLETSIYERLRLGMLDFSGAGACAIWLCAVNFLPALFNLRREWLAPRAVMLRQPENQTRTLWPYVLAFIWVLPYGAALYGMDATTWSTELSVAFAAALRTSLMIAVCTVVVTLLWVSWILWASEQLRVKRAARWLLLGLTQIPAGISVFIYCLGIWLTVGNWLDPLETHVWPIVFLQSLFSLPLALRLLLPLLEHRPQRALELAQILGASPRQAFWYAEWPRWRRYVAAVAGFVFAASLADVAIVMMFTSGDIISLPVWITRLLGQYQFGPAQLAAVGLGCVAMMCSWLATGLAQKASS